ncbi:hypothetical protein [Glycomyces harbinensis]|uniref:Uncharacterized protein n=1 Tax=Glycomyces harbinensis TaxID=58114 RepID=A0A1G6QQE4_9ACTN|nr:hypothetical protein [Glycomyces harbinensis]SDC93887.1 hypothetical protein SAMN05216270_10117 [Glycomyces harbinensis]
MRWVRIGIVGAFLLAAGSAGLAGFLASPDPDPGAPASAPPDLSATAEIRRSFMEPGIVAIAVTNHGDAPVRVLGVELVTDSFAPLGEQEFDAEVPPSVNPRDLMTAYGSAQCPDGAASTAAPATAVLRVETEDGAAHVVTAALPHPNGTLDRLVKEACAAQVIAAAAAIELGPMAQAENGTLTADLTLRSLTGAELAVTDVRGSVLFALTAGGREPAPDGGAVVAIGFEAVRCDGHAIGDVKQPFGFTAWIAIDGAEPVATPIPVPDEQRDDLWAMLDAACGNLD